jgi:hypothetical protein
MRLMRYFGLISLAALALAPSMAGAQQSGSPMGDAQDMNRLATRGTMTQWAATRPAQTGGFSPETMSWLADQTQRQIIAPVDAATLSKQIDSALADDLKRVARDQGVKAKDLSRALLLKVMMDAKWSVEREFKAAKAGNDPDTPKIQARLDQAEANRKAAVQMQTQKSTQIALD